MNKITLTILALLAVSGLILSACTPVSAPAILSGTSWKLISYGPSESQTQAASGIDTSLVFGTDGTVSGNMGCNNFSGKYEMKDATLIFSQIISTMMACPDPAMTQEGTVFSVLNGTVQFKIQGTTLTIHASSGDKLLILYQVGK
jgi:heat shock protein HslJ